MRKTHNQCHVTMRSPAPAKPWLESNLSVTLPIGFTSCSRRGEPGQYGVTPMQKDVSSPAVHRKDEPC
jgi:hypothetical protein